MVVAHTETVVLIPPPGSGKYPDLHASLAADSEMLVAQLPNGSITRVQAGVTHTKRPAHTRRPYLFVSLQPNSHRYSEIAVSLTRYYSMISVTTPDPTVLPPSLIANLSPSSIAIGVISLMLITTLSPGMHISVPSGRFRSPVTSVVLK